MVDFNGLYNQPKIEYASFENDNFVSGSSPAVIDVFDYFARDIHNGEIRNDGPGNIRIELSSNGVDYGGILTLMENEKIDLTTFKPRKIRITHTGTDSSYRSWFW